MIAEIWNSMLCFYTVATKVTVHTITVCHVYKREDILRDEQTIAMIIELNHGIPGFDNDQIKDILYYISTK